MKKYGLKRNKGPYWFKDNNSKILAVAHLDSVQEWTHCKFLGDRVYSPTLDDRLGVWVILEGLKGLTFDILLTTNEEMCASTAADFKTKRQYNWIFEFDRSGTDVVMYDYESKEMEELLAENKFRLGVGSYTDICEIEHLNCKGFNFGTAYYDYHNQYAYANIPQLLTNIDRFKSFYLKYSKTRFPHTPTEKIYYSHFLKKDTYSDMVECSGCGMEIEIDDAEYAYGTYPLCQTCFSEWISDMDDKEYHEYEQKIRKENQWLT